MGVLTIPMKDKEIRQAVRECQLNILIKLDEVCRNNGLRYYLAFGTCLGSLRHKGFIPWDDDIDVLMPYSDAKKLIELQGEFGDKYFVQSKETDREYDSIAMRIRDEDTTCIEKNEIGLKIHKGIYVDIYPYYECSNNRIVRLLDILRSNLLKVLVNNKPPVNHGKFLAMMAEMVLKCYSEKRRMKTINKLENRLASVRGDEILDYYGEDISLFSAISYPKRWFDIPKQLEFEGRYFCGATEPEKYMEKRYGDYMKLPPVKDRVFHHDCVVINPYKSYKEYEGVK